MNTSLINKYHKFIKSYIAKREKNKDIIDDLVNESICAMLEHNEEPTPELERAWVVQRIKAAVSEYKQGSKHNLVFKSSHTNSRSNYAALRREVLSTSTHAPRDIGAIAKKLKLPRRIVEQACLALLGVYYIDGVSETEQEFIQERTNQQNSPEDITLSIDAMEKILLAINCLPKEEANVLLDKYVYEKSRTECYKGLSVSQYFTLLRKASENLKALLKGTELDNFE